MNYDTYEEVINGEKTYKRIAEVLNNNKSCLIGWTDGQMSHFDILFTCNAMGFGHFQGGVKPDDLFVSIMRVGCFGFETNNIDTHSGYYTEKLTRGSSNFFGDAGSEALGELINGVKKHLQ